MKVYNMTAKLKESGTKIEIGSIRDWQDWPMYHDEPQCHIEHNGKHGVTLRTPVKHVRKLSIETPEQAEQRITKSHKNVLDTLQTDYSFKQRIGLKAGIPD